MSEYLDRIRNHWGEMVERKERLIDFMRSDRFQSIRAKQRTLIGCQLSFLSTYCSVLEERIRDIEENGGIYERAGNAEEKR